MIAHRSKVTTCDYFAAPDRAQALQTALARWLGTPFRRLGAVPGPDGGINCTRFPHEVLVETGWMDRIPEDQIPDLPVNWRALSSAPLLVHCIGGLGLMNRCRGVESLDDAPIGSVLLFGYDGRYPAHMGIRSSVDDMVHCLQIGGVQAIGLYHTFVKRYFRYALVPQEAAK